jgi:hypothetical protein
VPINSKMGVEMTMITKLGTTGALALSLAMAGLGVPQASAHDGFGGRGGAGLFLGLASGLIIGGALANEHRYHPNYYYDNASCYPGPLQWRWEQVCRPDSYGQLDCRNVKTYYRPEICN